MIVYTCSKEIEDCRKEKKPMSKKGKKKSGHKRDLTNLALATAIINLLITIIELISKIFD